MKLIRASALLFLFATAGCESSSPVPRPSLVPQPAQAPVQTPVPVPVSVRDITVGERVEGVYGDGKTISPGEHHFFLTAPRTGTLTATLAWDPFFVGTLLKLTLDGRGFLGERPTWSPVVGQVPVVAGRRYLLVVSLGGADWLPHDPFVLTTRLD